MPCLMVGPSAIKAYTSITCIEDSREHKAVFGVALNTYIQGAVRFVLLERSYMYDTSPSLSRIIHGLSHPDIKCQHCNAEYIGLTTNTFRQRMNGHRADTKQAIVGHINNLQDKPVSTHATHNKDFDSCYSTRVQDGENADSRKTLHTAKLQDLDSVYDGKCCYIGPMLIEKGEEFYEKLKLTVPCTFSEGWLTRFIGRHGIRKLVDSGEQKSAEVKAADKCFAQLEGEEGRRLNIRNFYLFLVLCQATIEHGVEYRTPCGKHSLATEILFPKSYERVSNLPGLPTMKRMSAMSSLLNMAALRSRTVGLVACQLGSMVDWPGDTRLKVVLVAVDVAAVALLLTLLGDARGEVGALAGCVICIASLCEMLCGGDSPTLFSVSAGNCQYRLENVRSYNK
ncbi:hypothetical protein PR048_024959, partial [Dryococelus australis]